MPYQPAIAPRGEAKSNNEIFRLLAQRMGLDDPSHHESDEALIRSLLARDHPLLDGVTYEHLASDGWARFAHEPGTTHHDGTTFRLRALDASRPDAPATHRYQLISPKQHVRFLNANYGQFRAHQPSPSVPVLELHPVDAADLALADGDRARVWNERGELTLDVSITDRLQPGLVGVPFGWGHAATEQRRAVNALTNAAVRDDDQGSAAFFDTWVSIEPA